MIHLLIITFKYIYSILRFTWHLYFMDFITTTLIRLYVTLNLNQNTATHNLRVKLPRFKLFTISYLYASFGQYINSVVLRC